MLQRFFSFLSVRNKARLNAARALYQQIVTQSRQPIFYAEWGVPDTVDGRFDAILCHAALVIARLQLCGTEGIHLAQSLFDVMFRDMDVNLREIGIGDMSVRKHFKRMSRFFNGRIRHYSDALLAGDKVALEQVLVRNLYRKTDISAPSVTRMADYLLDNFDHLKNQGETQIMTGALEFKQPSA